MINLTMKLLRHGQIYFGNGIVIGPALVPTILGIFNTMAGVK